jgi:alpha,alpha-trehalase
MIRYSSANDQRARRDGFLSSFVVCVLLLLPICAAAQVASMAERAATPVQLQALRSYVKQSWQTLKRSNGELARAAVDPKFTREHAGKRSIVYLARDENRARVEAELRRQMTAQDFASIELRVLPEDHTQITEQGLLYLPHPYVVPGGRFNEMYGWDSYFIQVGLLRDNEIELAKNVIDNHLYQIEHYGAVLNANRTYFLSRSQPPFLTQMILGVYRQTKDKMWLRRTLPKLEKYYRFWIEPPHLTAATGLARYYDRGVGPAPEVIADERDEQGRTHYERVKEYYRTHEITDYDVKQYYDRERDELTPLFYTGDRSMRESGFDPSNRFGTFNTDVINYNPVCLNSLLYLMETETAEIMRLLGEPRARQQVWLKRAAKRRAAINRLMWDERDGLYYDYNFTTKRVRRYPFATTFYPLWAGIATRAQAARLVANLKRFERPGGLLTSTNVSGSQWDAPFGWAPLQLIAVEGLRRYGYTAEADRISVEFLSMILKDFIEHNTIVEKYDVERRDSDVAAGIKFGYAANQIGFGWTNGAFIELYARMTPARRADVLNTNISTKR